MISGRVETLPYNGVWKLYVKLQFITILKGCALQHTLLSYTVMVYLFRFREVSGLVPLRSAKLQAKSWAAAA